MADSMRQSELIKASRDLLDGIANGRSNLVMECSILRDAIEAAEGEPECGVPAKALCLFKDGNQWCATYADFINLQESPAGFGETWEEAARGLQSAEEDRLNQLQTRIEETRVDRVWAQRIADKYEDRNP